LVWLTPPCWPVQTEFALSSGASRMRKSRQWVANVKSAPPVLHIEGEAE
jgi:hypothetical protein